MPPQKQARRSDSDDAVAVPEHPRKGAKIVFVGGTHAGKQGWLDKKKKPTKSYTYVLVLDDENDPHSLSYTHVQHHNFCKENAKAETFAEAVLMQRPKVHKSLRAAVKLCSGMLEDQSDIDDFTRIFNEMLNEAYVDVVYKQMEEGPRGVQFDRKKKNRMEE